MKISSLALKKNPQKIKKRIITQTAELVMAVVSRAITDKYHRFKFQNLLSLINERMGVELLPHWDLNQISTHSSPEVRAGISLTSGPGAWPPGG